MQLLIAGALVLGAIIFGSSYPYFKSQEVATGSIDTIQVAVPEEPVLVTEPVAVQPQEAASTSSALIVYDKEVYIAALAQREAVLKSGDAARIRSYLHILASSPDERADLASYTDEKILELAPFLAEFSFTREVLLGPTATWTFGADLVEVEIQEDASTTLSTKLKKVDGAWY